MTANLECKAPQQLRNYQVELFEIVKKQNSILFLPTGSGKTCIALWLIKYLAADLKKSYAEGGKRTIFIVNTKELAYQQAAYVADSGNFKVRVVCAEEGVDNWRVEQWNQLEDFEVIVMTAQCYLDALTHSYMKLQNVNLLIFDECHHATKAHPMREIMRRFDILPRGNNGPRVLGLSATILNSNKKSEQVDVQLAELERTFRSTIVTTTFTQDVAKYATKPEEVIKDFNVLELPPALTEFLKVHNEESELFAKCFKLKDDEITEHLMESKPANFDILINAPGMNRTKILITAIKDITVHCHEFGIFIGFVACNLYIIQMYRFMFELERTQYVDLVLYFINVAQVIRKTLHKEIMKINGKFSFETMMKASTEKLKYLFDVLRTLNRTDKCIIFVERKITAKALCFIIKWFARLEKVSNIDVDFITGTDCNPLRNTRELLHEKKMKNDLLKRFRGDALNVLIATNIVEEGIDIPNCGLVIMFDEIKSYRSYVQSKGRARMQSSKYIVLNQVPRAKFLERLRNYRRVEELLNIVIRQKDISDWDDDSPDRSENGEFYTTSKGASIKEENCVSLIHHYCSSLPSDIYTSLIPFWWSANDGPYKICKLQLPINSPIREILVGPPRLNLKKSKQEVAFQAVKLLHQLGGLNDQLLPVKGSAALEDTKEWVPNWEEPTTQDSGEPSIGQEQFMSKLKSSTFLQDSRQVANEESYVHFIEIRPEYEVPDVNRKKFCHKLMGCDYNFGILTKKPLPNLCRFPVYSDLGRCQVSISSNCDLVILDEKQISYVARFHKFLFLNVIRNVKKWFLFDAQSASDYFIVPLTRKETGVEIAWKVVRQKIETVIRQPSELDRETEEFSEENYLGKVVAPWYRNVDNPSFYIVTNFFSELYLHSEIEKNKTFTFGEHFEKTYNLRALQPGQPMMEVRPITKNFDCIKPRPIPSSTKQKKKNNEDKPTYLPPEFVAKQSLNSVYWYKSILLPSILHRFQQLLLAEDLRQTLVEKTGVGRFDIAIDRSEENDYFIKTVKVPITVQHISKIRTLRIKERKTLVESEKIPDLVRDINHCDDLFKLTVDDIKKYVDYVDEPLHVSGRVRAACSDSEDSSIDDNTIVNGKYVIRHMPAPELITLRENVDSPGPNQYEILQALTLRAANDAIDLERFETLGDSLLKYLVSFAIFIREGRMNEGLLTCLKGRIVGNKYLFDCAKKHQIPDYIQAATFTVDRTWIPPSFCVPPYLNDIIPALGKFSSLLKVTIPYHEQFSGNLSPESVERIGDELKEFFQTVEDIDKLDESVALFSLGLRKLSHKSISDVVEALIGVYLQTCGIEGAFNVMKYFGILQKEDYAALMSHKIPPSVGGEHERKVLNLIPDYRKLECLLNYEFRDKALLLQALTHQSCYTNHLTDCYQKLEFVGDAVLDFLITSYIYQYCGQLSPGEITDLRSSLVNNNTFGALAVRLGLQKYLLDHNKYLEEAIRSFVSYQKSRNYEIHGNDMMILVNEGDTVVVEEVDVPKVLGDVFEALAGAIFLDSGYNLSAVWNIFFNIMAEEIAKFCSKVPKNPIRVLYERFVNKAKFNFDAKRNKEAENNGERLIVRLCVHTKEESHTFTGRGLNKLSAKRAVAKLALKHFGYSEFVI